MEDDFAALEARVDALIAFTRELQDANDILRRELLALQERNRDLNGRVTQATTRLDALIAKVNECRRATRSDARGGVGRPRMGDRSVRK